jgi:2-(1,2-epoxy-1,2-dihydrophenyl)acetyl-CoA isomerase
MLSLEFETVELDVADAVATVTMNRPDALNAWTRQLGTELGEALDHAASDPEVRVIVVTGAGRAFSSGADLREAGQLTDEGKPDVLAALRQVYNPVIMRVRSIPKPVLAAVNGPAVGIACSFALAADLIVAAESAYFLLAFVNIGLALDGGASAFLPARVGHARAAEIAMLGGRIPAPTALDWGLVNRVAGDHEFASAVAELAGKLAAGPPGSYATIKQTLGEHSYAQLAEVLDREAVLQQERAASADFVEGVTAFMQKRPARFTGA